MASTAEEFWGTNFTSSKIIFYFIFWGVHVILFAAGWYVIYLWHTRSPAEDYFRYIQASDARLSALNALQYSVWISRGSALTLSLDVALILLPMCRNIIKCIRPRIRWMPLDETVWFHRQVAYSLLLFTVIHVASHYVKWVHIIQDFQALTH